LQEMIHAGVALLPARQREAWKLSREANCSHAEIARRMGLSKNTVKIHVVKALNFLRAYIQEHSDNMGIVIVYFLQKYLK
jgi:RNA polymerase sigma factor (sigma-70 family)